MKYYRLFSFLVLLMLTTSSFAFKFYNESSYPFSFSVNGICASPIIGNVQPKQVFSMSNDKLKMICGDMTNKKYCDIDVYASENCAEILAVTISTMIDKPYIFDVSELSLLAIKEGFRLSASPYDIRFYSREK